MTYNPNLLCKTCGHRQDDHGLDEDLDPNCEDELVESGEFYACQIEGCDCQYFGRAT